MSEKASALEIMSIYHPYAVEKYNIIKNNNTRFVHYCTAEAAFCIINGESMRLRNASVMNDFSEIEHGKTCLAQAWRSESGDRLKKIIDGMYEGVSGEIASLVDSWAPFYKSDTYIACMSEHDDLEDDYGRLSMWRAYGGPMGVAVVINPDVFLGDSESIPAITSPVAYLSEDEYIIEFGKVVENIRKNREYILQSGKGELTRWLYHAFRLSILGTKHPGFREEREWRVIYSPKLASNDRIKKSVELIRGIPQEVYNIKFEDYPDEGLVGVALPSLINRIIIGPTEFPDVVRNAFIALLKQKNVENAEEKVVCSTIPLRQ